MKKIWTRLLLLSGIFILAAAAFTVYLFLESKKPQPEPEMEYSAMEKATYPMIGSSLNYQTISLMHGYSSERSMDCAETPIVIAEDNRVYLKIQTYGNQVKKLSWKIRERDQEDILYQDTVTTFQGDSDNKTFYITPGGMLETGRDYLLEMVLQTGDDQEIYYYGRIRNGEDIPASDLMNYAIKFHEAAYDIQKAEGYALTLETDKTQDSNTLANVNINSTVGQFAWGSLNPTEVPGSSTFTIMEIDDNFASFLVQYMVTAGSEEKSTCLVEEYFSVHCTQLGYYLMDYQRDTTQLFTADASRLQAGILDFGIVSEDDVQVRQSEDGSQTVFAIGGELWKYQEKDNLLTKVFSFLDEEDLIRSSYPNHELKILDVTEEGDISFLLYGYMNSGSHEGSVGVSCMQYDSANNALKELFFLPYNGSFEYLKFGIDSLACMGNNGKVYLMVGDSVYTVDYQNQEVIMLANRVLERNLVVNEDQTAIAWQLDSSQELSNRVQILYLDTGDQQLMEVPEGDWIAPQGFIDDDIILTQGNIQDIAEVNTQLIHPFYSLEIISRSGKSEAKYSYDGIYISSVTVTQGQVELKRLQKDSYGNFHVVNDDTLIQNEVSEPETLVLTTRTDDLRRRIYTLDLMQENPSGEGPAYLITEVMGHDPQTNFNLSAVEDESLSTRYYAYGEGHLLTVSDQAGPAIAAACDKMGIVYDSRGRVIWYRTGHELSKTLNTANAAVTGTEENSSDLCLTMIAKMAGMDASISDIADAASVSEAMESFLPGRTLNLTGAPVKGLIYYLNQGAPVLVVQSSGYSVILIGYDQYNVVYYDPVEGTTIRQGQNDADEFLSDGCSLLGYIPRQ